jgi:hypothetical protein
LIIKDDEKKEFKRLIKIVGKESKTNEVMLSSLLAANQAKILFFI